MSPTQLWENSNVDPFNYTPSTPNDKIPGSFASLNEQHRIQLASSGIPLELAVEVGLRSVDAEAVRRLLGRNALIGPGLAIPFRDPQTGEPIRSDDGQEFVRIRLDDPSLAQDRDGKPCKYLTRRSAGQHPYITPETARAIREGAQEIVLVEGEKKALSAIAHGIVAIGLTGNWGWKTKDAQALLPLLAEFLPPGRTVVVVWDSDAVLNTGFAASSRMLHDALRRHGCAVKMIVLPQCGAMKVGLDDFLVALGADPFKALVTATLALPSDRQVSTDELLLGWCGALRDALVNLPASEAEALLAQNFKKGFIDHVAQATRLKILLRLQEGCSIIVGKIFRRVVEEHLTAKFGPLTTGAKDLAKGDIVKLGDGTRAVVVSMDDTYAWVARDRQDGKSWPMPVQFLQLRNKPISPARVADDFIAKYHVYDTKLTLHHSRSAFFRWTGCRYAEVPEVDIEAEVMGFLRQRSPKLASPSFRQAVIANLKSAGVCHIPSFVEIPCRLEPGYPHCPNTISFLNGNLDVDALLRGEPDDKVWKTPTPMLFSTHGRKFAFDPSATCPKFSSFLTEALPDEALRNLVQEIAGYCLVSNTTMQRFFLFYGPGANGKQVFCEVLAELVGIENVCAVSLARFGERFSLWPITTHLVNLVAELPTAEGSTLRIAEDKLKAIVSGDFIEVEKKNKDIVKARPTARLIFSTNELPPIVDRSNGVWRRLIIAPFGTVIPVGRQDPDLPNKLIATELPGAFNWALEGLIRLLKRGHFEEPDACRKLKEEHRLACISEEAFLREHVATAGADEFVYVDDLYAAYRTYVNSGGGNPIAMKRFSPAVQRVFPEARKDRHKLPERKRAAGYWGLKFYPDGIPEPEESK